VVEVVVLEAMMAMEKKQKVMVHPQEEELPRTTTSRD